MILRPGKSLAALLQGAVFLVLAAASPPAAAQTEWSLGGHSKFQFIYLDIPDNSLFREVLGSGATDNYLETRLNLDAQRQGWKFELDYQFIAAYAETLRLAKFFPDSALPVNSVINDDRRWWNLTWSSWNGGQTALVHRLDRLNVSYSTDHMVWRFGRQAISWGNGMIFTPMDIFNPFDPAAVDKEYKTGDDMLYGQYLLNNGNDIQGVAVVRRNPRSGEVESDQSSFAVKFHGFLGLNEFDLLAAQHFSDQVLGAGGIISIGGAIWRGDLTWTRTDRNKTLSAATSLGYSWNWGGRNINGLVEYYYSGFGQKDGAYSPADLLGNPDLLKRLERGELFTLARHYIAASATIELTPLLLVTPNIFINVVDPSALAQLVVQYNWKQNLVVLGSLNIPIGPDGSEYGGTATPYDDIYFSTGPGVFTQLAWYF